MRGVDDYLSGNATATDIENLQKNELILVAKLLREELLVEGKAKVKALVLQALAEHNLLKGTVKVRGLESELEL